MWNMVGVGCGRMVEQLNAGARPRWGASRCHQVVAEPLVVTENFLLPHAVVLPSCRHRQQVQAWAARPDHQGAFSHPLLLRVDWGSSCRWHSLMVPAPIAPRRQWVRVGQRLSGCGNSGGSGSTALADGTRAAPGPTAASQFAVPFKGHEFMGP